MCAGTAELGGEIGVGFGDTIIVGGGDLAEIGGEGEGAELSTRSRPDNQLFESAGPFPFANLAYSRFHNIVNNVSRLEVQRMYLQVT